MAGRYWREAATLILVGRTAQKYNCELLKSKYKNFKANWTPPDYNLLFLKRSSKSSFMPETYVFPGGALDEADLDPKWLSLFKNHGFSKDDLIQQFRLPGSQPEIYANKSPSNGLFPELAFRICALRETFEETGLLLATPAGQNCTSFTSPFSLEGEEMREWRRNVHQDASQFIHLMERINGIPSVFNLSEWVSWLTPTTFKSARRFDTAFYIAFIDSQIPLHAHDKHEAEELIAEGPFQLLLSSYEERAFVAPPQVYELSRLLNCQSLETLKEFSLARSRKGLARIFPEVFRTNDGIIFVYPGDSLYPSNPDIFGLEGMKSIDQTIEEARASSTHVNRFEKDGKTVYGGNLVIKNFTQPFGHLNPMSFKDVVEPS